MAVMSPASRPPALAVATLSVSIVVGVLLGVLTADETKEAWPPQASQVLVTLLVAATLEQYTAPRKAVGWTAVSLAAALALGVLAALVACVHAASEGSGFSVIEAGVVNGALAALGLVVVVGLLWRVWPDKGGDAN